jgi:hypothetical protein
MNTTIRHIWAITKRELAVYFTSPLAYVFIVIFLLLCGFFTFFVSGFFQRGDASLTRSFFDWHPWFYLFLVPAVGMRLWADERRLGTIELLFTMPITPWQAILGKFIASWLFLALALILTFPVCQLPWRPRKRRDLGRLHRQLADGRCVPSSQLCHIGTYTQSGGKFHIVTRCLSFSDPVRVCAGDKSAGATR